MKVTNTVKALREARGWTQEDLAKKAGVTRQTINAIENNKYSPTLILAIKLAQLFEQPVESIFTLEQEG